MLSNREKPPSDKEAVAREDVLSPITDCSMLQTQPASSLPLLSGPVGPFVPELRKSADAAAVHFRGPAPLSRLGPTQVQDLQILKTRD